MKKILIMYGSYGSGHKTIANYIKNYLEENSKYEIMIHDITEHSNYLGNLGMKLYDCIIKHRAKLFFSLSYKFTDHKLITLKLKKLTVKSFDNKINRRIIKNFNPDLVISTHFFANKLIAHYNDLGLINTKIITIITDYKCHECWINQNQDEDAFIVGNEIVKNELVRRGVPSKKVFPFGLPLKPDIKLDNKDIVLKKYNLKKGKPIYLFFGGGSNGCIKYYDYFKILAKSKLDFNLIFVCGKNTELKEKCDKLVKKYKLKNVKVLGFTSDVFNLMNISDTVISKSGGATVTECIEIRKPMIIIPGYGGQEKYNQKFMVHRHFAISVKTTFGLKRIVKKTIKNPNILSRMSKKMQSYEKNDSTKKILNLVNKMLK